MKKILGLDLGSASIGWAMVETDDENTHIVGLGSRVIPYGGTEGKDFDKGAGESRNAIRTIARTARKGYDRYQLRRKALVAVLIKNLMYPGQEIKAMPKIELWNLRARAVTERVELEELGRLLLWLNQKRGYKSSRSDANLNKKDTEYVAEVKSRHQIIREREVTIGQFFYEELLKNGEFRIKNNIFPREAYIEELNAICLQQQKYHSILSNELISEIRDRIIYYQRPLKSQKGLVSVCEFECKEYINKENGKTYLSGPKVAPKSSPMFQLDKMWQNINNIRLSSTKGEDIELTSDHKKAIFTHLDTHEKLTKTDLVKILARKDIIDNKQIKVGIKGNTTKCAILGCFGDRVSKYADLLRFDVKLESDANIETSHYSKKTGEVLGVKPKMWVSADIEHEPYNRLWHTIYSISEQKECKRALVQKFGIEDDIASKLAALDLTNGGFGNKCAKVIRNILPYLIQGDRYDVAMAYAGYDHSFSMTKDENMARELLEKLKPIAKNSLRQPIVEKILNQMVNVVNAAIEIYGKPDEIRVELARELKQSKEERSDTDMAMRKREKENEQIVKSLKEYGISGTRRNIIKWRLYHEINCEDKKLNATCIYCGEPISLTHALSGDSIEIEHIIPKAKLFDDSQSNKTLAHRKCNQDKNDRTAYDFMLSKSNGAFEDYVNRVNLLYTNHLIGKAKRDKLLMSEYKIPQNFIDRQLRESQYIARKAREILQTVCRDVWSTSGGVTSELRRLWGWDDITMNLQFDRYKNLGLTTFVEWTSEHGKNSHKKEVIANFSKRNDHRHHAIDALVVACTKQGYIQRLNTLSSSKTRAALEGDMQCRSVDYKTKLTLMEKYFVSEQPILVSDVSVAVDNILISFKSGKKAATVASCKIGKRGKKRVVQKGVIVPRGSLHEESVYGKVRVIEQRKPLKFLFQNPSLIYKPYIKLLVEQRLLECDSDVKIALKSLEKGPIFLDDAQKVKLEYATCYKDEYVIKYEVNTDFAKVDKVIDPVIRDILQKRLAKFGGKAKEAFKDVGIKGEQNNTIKWYEDEGLQRPIHSVRCFTGLSAVVPVKRNANGDDIGFVKPGNNHHVAIYRDANGVQQEQVVTFWHSVERKKYGVTTIIKDPVRAREAVKNMALSESFLENLPDATWTFEQSIQQNEMFVLGMDEELYQKAIKAANYSLISKYLYRVQKLSKGEYCFRHHLETTTDDKYNEEKNVALSKTIGKCIIVNSFGAWNAFNPHKVKINLLGELVSYD